MATAFVDTIEVRNIGNQAVQVYVAPLIKSQIYKPAGGYATVKPAATLLAENNRFDANQLNELKRRKVIEVTNGKQQVPVASSQVGSH